MKKTARILLLLVCIVATLWGWTIAWAISDPDSTPSVSNTHINRNLLTSGDILIYGEYDIPYATPPSVFANESYIFQLIASDNSTILGAITPFVFFDNGYNEGVFSFYFSSMSSANITWGGAYSVRILQNPAQFASPTKVDYAIPTNVYTSANSTADNQVDLAINVIAEAGRLEEYHSGYSMLDTSAGGTVLYSPTGETYFRGAIFGIQAMAPSLFMVQVLEYDTSYRTWTTAYTDNMSQRFTATWVGASENATADLFGTTKQTAFGLIPLTISIGAIVVSSMKWRKSEFGIIVTAVVLICALLMGWLAPAIFASLYQSMGMYIAYLLFLARAG